MKHGMLLFTLLAGIALGSYCSLDSWSEYKAKSQELNKARREYRNVARQRTDLLTKVARLETPYGLEQEARQLGFRKRGEVQLTGL